MSDAHQALGAGNRLSDIHRILADVGRFQLGAVFLRWKPGLSRRAGRNPSQTTSKTDGLVPQNAAMLGELWCCESIVKKHV